MATWVGTRSKAGGNRSHLPPIGLTVVVLLCAFVVGSILVTISTGAQAQPVAASPNEGPVALSGTVSYASSYTVPGPCPGCRTSEDLSVTMAVAGAAMEGEAANPGPDWDNPDVEGCAQAASRASKCFWASLTVESASVHYHFASQLAVPNRCSVQASAAGTYKSVSTPEPLGLDIVFNPSGSNGTKGVKPVPASVLPFGPSGLPPARSYRVAGNVAVQMALSYTNRAAAATCGIKLPSSTWDIPIDFEGSYRLGETELRGSTTYPALGPPHVAWDLRVKPTGLDITSPVATSTIALTDGNYLSPQPGPGQSAPTKRELTIKGIDTSPGASVVTMGRVSGRIASDGTWSIQIPVQGPGKTVLSVRDNVGATADEQVTLIDLVITTPAEGAILPITTAPAMPRLGAVAGVQGYEGNVSAVIFNWALSVRGEYRDRCGHNPNGLCGQWYAYNDTVASGTTTGRSPWAGDSTAIEGGFGRMTASADIPGVLDEPVRSEPRWIDIPGTNPAVPTIEAYVSAQDPADAPVENELFCHESRFTQFNPDPEPREPATTTVPHDIGPDPAPLRPLFGAEFAGIGIAQKDPASFPAQQWDWHANVQSGISVYQEDKAAAKGWRQAEQVRLSGELTAVLKVVNGLRAQRGMKILRTVALRVPPLSTAQLQREAIRRYNGENEFRFNLHYVISSNHLMVKTAGTGKWVEGAGEWQSMTAWQAAGGPLVARQWIPAQDPGYVTLVRACHL